MEKALEASAFDRHHGLAQALQLIAAARHRFGRFRLVQPAQQCAGPPYGFGVFALLDQDVNLRLALTGEMRQAFRLVRRAGLQSGPEIAELLMAVVQPVRAPCPRVVRQRVLGPSLGQCQVPGPVRQPPRGFGVSFRVGQIQAGPYVLQPSSISGSAGLIGPAGYGVSTAALRAFARSWSNNP
ncbi:hypothetical protein ABZS86_03295 [Streptomyces sp. NPDC005355]|uniref:hypothetical protein n=1 Tax=Streptomyces sp. NPDC005355 TaxID=3157038 RepID=UPI0033BDBBFA